MIITLLIILSSLFLYLNKIICNIKLGYKDVLIDYSGFAISALVITIAFLAYYFIKKAIKKHKEKNNK